MIEVEEKGKEREGGDEDYVDKGGKGQRDGWGEEKNRKG